MKNMSTAKIGWVILLGAILLFSCNGKVTTRPKQTNYQFTINGVMVKDKNLGNDVIYYKVLRDSVNFDGAMVIVNADTIKSNGNGMYIKQATKLFNYGQNIPIQVSSAADNFNLSTSILMPGSFEITEIEPRDSMTVSQTDEVYMKFDLSAGASGYYMSVIQPVDVDGYTATIPAEDIEKAYIDRNAFYNGDNPVYGWYKVYVVAYRSSFLEYPGMSFFLPDGLPTSNITGANGVIAAGVVALSDSLKLREASPY
jgi:hypothetical protein